MVLYILPVGHHSTLSRERNRFMMLFSGAAIPQDTLPFLASFLQLICTFLVINSKEGKIFERMYLFDPGKDYTLQGIDSRSLKIRSISFCKECAFLLNTLHECFIRGKPLQAMRPHRWHKKEHCDEDYFKAIHRLVSGALFKEVFSKYPAPSADSLSPASFS